MSRHLHTVLLFLDLHSRRIHLCTESPTKLCLSSCI